MRRETRLDAVRDEMHALFQLQRFQCRLEPLGEARDGKRWMRTLHRLRDTAGLGEGEFVFEGFHESGFGVKGLQETRVTGSIFADETKRNHDHGPCGSLLYEWPLQS